MPEYLENEPLSKHVNFRIGGPAKLYALAKSSDEIVEAVTKAQAEDMPFVVLGGGSNILPSDNGYDGMVIQAANRSWNIDGETVTAEAGVPSAFLARKTAEAGLAGFEWAISLPGTVGGAVRGNAGCFGGETKDVVKSVEILHVTDGGVERKTITNAEAQFGYRESVFKQNDDIVLSVTLKLKHEDAATVMERLEGILAKRKTDQPAGEATAGCMFKNFEYQDESEIEKLKSAVGDIPEAFLEMRRIPAGWLIDQLGLKGQKIGGASVSEKHGNFLLNDGTATASDVVQLISLIKMKVRNTYGIQLSEEVHYLSS